MPLRLVSEVTTDVGQVTATTNADEIVVVIDAAGGWEIGDAYVGAGTGSSTLVWFSANAEPWITGWQSSVEVHIPLGDAGLHCADTFKLWVQVYVRPKVHEDPNTRYLASALGSYPVDNPEWGWWDYYTVCCSVGGCTLTQGFWKTHPDEWPVDELEIGGITYDENALLALLRTPVRGDASLALAHQLIAALLNVASGASPIATIDQAQDWMSAHGSGPLPYGIAPSSTDGPAATALTELLGAYNEGESGPGHCGDTSEDLRLTD